MLRNIFAFGILVLLRQLLLKSAALCGQTGDNPSHYRNRRACTHACDVGTGSIYWTTHNTPVQYIQHTSPVHTTHQSSTYNTPVQYIQHTSPVHTTHQSSTYNTPVQYIQHTSPVHTTHVVQLKLAHVHVARS